MKVVIAGGHGKIALHVERLLAERGDHSVGLIRDPAQEADVVAAGGFPVVIDLESASAAEVATHLAGADAVIFAAGAGAGSTAERKDSVDRGAAALLADAAILAGIRRYVLVSAIGSDAGAQPEHDPVFAAYMTAKKAADDDLRSRDLDWTVVRPGALTDGSGSGHVTLAVRVGRGSVPREDVAAVLVALLDDPRTAGLSLDLVSGRHPIADAVGEAASVALLALAAESGTDEPEASPEVEAPRASKRLPELTDEEIAEDAEYAAASAAPRADQTPDPASPEQANPDHANPEA